MSTSFGAKFSRLACGFALALPTISGCMSGRIDDPFGSAPDPAGANTGAGGAVSGAGQPAVPGGTGSSPIGGGATGAAGQGSASNAAGANGDGGAAGSPAVSCSVPLSSTASWVCLDGYKLMVAKRQADGSLATLAPYKLKGVSWSPTGIGERNTNGYSLYYTKYGAQDVPLIAGASANTVKTYNAFELNEKGLALLDSLYASGVMVVMTVMPSYWDTQGKAYLQAVNYFKGHPAILMWVIGNEMNNNRLYDNNISLDTAVGLAATAIDDIHAADPAHPVAVSWSNSPFDNGPAYYTKLAHADVWALNLYPWLDVKTRFDTWQIHSPKPIFVGEYGADAWNAKLSPPGEDQPSQAQGVQTLTQQIVDYYSATTSHAVLGGCPFELTDEWWKGGDANTHGTGGFANGGVYPDGYANEGWWGLATVQRQTRKAYDALKTLYAAP